MGQAPAGGIAWLQHSVHKGIVQIPPLSEDGRESLFAIMATKEASVKINPSPKSLQMNEIVTS